MSFGTNSVGPWFIMHGHSPHSSSWQTPPAGSPTASGSLKDCRHVPVFDYRTNNSLGKQINASELPVEAPSVEVDGRGGALVIQEPVCANQPALLRNGSLHAGMLVHTDTDVVVYH